MAPKVTHRYLSALGNANILWGHIQDMEKELVANNENCSPDEYNAPHFAAWIRMITEYVSNSLYQSFYHMTLDEECYDYGFNKIISKIEEKHRKNPTLLARKEKQIDNVISLIKMFIDLRHCFQHGGLPNISRKLNYTTPEKINDLLKPSNFENTRKNFLEAIEFTASLPKQSVGL